MIVFLSLVITAAVVRSTSVPITYGENFFIRFDIDLVDSTLSRTVGMSRGIAEVDFGYGQRIRMSNTATRQIDGQLSINNGLFVLTVDDLDEHEDFFPPLIYVSATDRSQLMTGLAGDRGLLVSPTSSTSGVLIIDPDNPSEYALDGQIYYTNQTYHSLSWSIRMGVAIGRG